jgi:hypothetical protein
MKENKDNRKGQVINLSKSVMDKIPKPMETIYKMERTPATDRDNPHDDETLFIHSLRTIEVESVIKVEGKLAVLVNGDFEIDLDEKEEERFSPNGIWRNKDDAVEAWLYNTELQIKKAEEYKARINGALNLLNESLEKRAY